MKITVFTPTYNRAHLIEQLYHSLQKQTYYDFEWLIVDDGSDDDTEEIVSKWLEEKNLFMIRYYKQNNGGKCSAINKGLSLANGDLFFTVDSDDYLTRDALEKIAYWESELSQENNYCGFAGNLGTSAGTSQNQTFEYGYFDGNPLDRYTQVNGERAMVFYTDIHRNYLYPIFDGETFMTEAVVWNRMARDGYKMRFYNDIIWIYEYQNDGLTKQGNSLFINNPKGYGLWLREKLQFTNASFIEKLKTYYTFACDLKEKYEPHFIAKCIGSHGFIISILLALHKIKNKF